MNLPDIDFLDTEAVVSRQLHKVTEQGVLVSPFADNVTIISYLKWYDSVYGVKNNKPRLTDEQYQKFLKGKVITVHLTNDESVGIEEVVLQRGDGTCASCNRENLADESFYNDTNLLLVPGRIGKGFFGGGGRKGVPYNFLASDRNAHRFYDCLSEVWKALYGIDASDPEFLKKLHELDDTAFGRTPPQQPAPQSQQRQSQPQSAAPASATVQTDANGIVTIGKFYRFSPVDCNAQLRKSKEDSGTNDQIESVIETMAKCFNQAIGISLGASRGKDATDEERKTEAAKLLGIKVASNKDDGGSKDDRKDENADSGDGAKAKKTAEDDELLKTEKYEYEVGFGDEPEIAEGTPVKLSRVQGALEAVKATTLAEGNSLGRMYKLVRAWDVLERVVKEATEAKLDTVGMACLHYRLSEVDAFMLKIQGKKGLIPLCFGNEKKPQGN